jgi:hypothetical protein
MFKIARVVTILENEMVRRRKRSAEWIYINRFQPEKRFPRTSPQSLCSFIWSFGIIDFSTLSVED